jgi:HEPN domain-containing protein
MKATTKEWLEFAKADLRSCEILLKDEFLTSIIAFHSQQAVEKAFKALIEEKGLTIPRVHSLQKLYDIIEQFIETKFEINELVKFDSIYTSSRYPGDIGLLESGKPTQNEAEELFESAKKIYETIIENIK